MLFYFILRLLCSRILAGGSVVIISDSQLGGREFDSGAVHYYLTSMFTAMRLSLSSTVWYQPKGGDAMH